MLHPPSLTRASRDISLMRSAFHLTFSTEEEHTLHQHRDILPQLTHLGSNIRIAWTMGLGTLEVDIGLHDATGVAHTVHHGSTGRLALPSPSGPDDQSVSGGAPRETSSCGGLTSHASDHVKPTGLLLQGDCLPSWLKLAELISSQVQPRDTRAGQAMRLSLTRARHHRQPLEPALEISILQVLPDLPYEQWRAQLGNKFLLQECCLCSRVVLVILAHYHQ